MTDKEPTQEQIKEFWEWCGFTSKIVRRKSADFNGIYQGTDGTFHTPPRTYDVELWHEPEMQGLADDDKWFAKNGLPPIDLNNLFKYAVPKLNGRYKLEGTGGYHFANVWKDPIAYVETRDTDPALALFWAIWEVIKR